MEEQNIIRSELELLLELLKIEKQEDFNQYKQFIESLPLEEKTKQGYAWYPLKLIKTGYTYGERAFLIVERTTRLEDPHQFRDGKTVNVYSRQSDAKFPERTGVVQYVEKNKMKIILNTRDVPDWLDHGGLGVDIMFDERTYLEMEKALQQVMKINNGRLALLKSVLIGNGLPQFKEVDNVHIPELNPSQNEAVNMILAADSVTVVHGPPGTGKTTTLVQAVRLVCEREKTVLVTAPSNTAVDVLTERLADQGLKVVRIGNLSRVDESLIRHTLEVQMSQHPESKNIKKIKIEAAEKRKQAARFKRNFGRAEKMERNNLYREANELNAWVNLMEQNLIRQILDSANVITCTLVGSVSDVLDGLKFNTVFIDEAAQALEPATWIPILKAHRVILAGDPHQLPPTVKSIEAQRKGFGKTLIEKFLIAGKPSTLLETQYRMNETIMGFSNAQFYNNKLMAAEMVKNHRILIEKNHPFIFIDTAGCGFEEKLEEKYQSRYNTDEAQILEEVLLQFVDDHGDQQIPSVAIISPYKEQVLILTESIHNNPVFAEKPITINTIDGFQGQERDVVYISLVRSNAKSEIGFLSDTRRMNVAMTRAKKQLVVIGDSATIGGHPFYEAFLKYCENFGLYLTAWEFMK